MTQYIDLATGRDCELPKQVIVDGKNKHGNITVEDCIKAGLPIREKPDVKADDGMVLLSVTYEHDPDNPTVAKAVKKQMTQADHDKAEADKNKAIQDALAAQDKAREDRRTSWREACGDNTKLADLLIEMDERSRW